MHKTYGAMATTPGLTQPDSRPFVLRPRSNRPAVDPPPILLHYVGSEVVKKFLPPYTRPIPSRAFASGGGTFAPCKRLDVTDNCRIPPLVNPQSSHIELRGPITRDRRMSHTTRHPVAIEIPRARAFTCSFFHVLASLPPPEEGLIAEGSPRARGTAQRTPRRSKEYCHIVPKDLVFPWVTRSPQSLFYP